MGPNAAKLSNIEIGGKGRAGTQTGRQQSLANFCPSPGPRRSWIRAVALWNLRRGRLEQLLDARIIILKGEKRCVRLSGSVPPADI